EVRLWDVSTGQQKVILQEPSHWVGSVALSPDGQTLASGSGDSRSGVGRVGDVAPGQQKGILQDHTSTVITGAVSPDGEPLASGSEDRTVRLWEVATRQQQARFRGHSNSVRPLALSQDGTAPGVPGGEGKLPLCKVAP